MDLYPWIVFLHVLGAFGFVLAHGASAFLTVSARRQRSPERLAALLDQSAGSITLMYPSLLILLIGGVWAGFAGSWWGHGWIWAAIGLLVLELGAMYGLAMPYYIALREAAGIRSQHTPQDAPAPVADPRELERLLDSSRPMLIMAIGVVGLALLIWLMAVKPF